MNIEYVVKYIKKNWNKGKGLKEISLLHRVDAGNLARAFRLSEGTTVKRFIDAKRKEYCIKIMTYNNKYGYQYAQELGFKNDRSFYRWVRRVFGCSYRDLEKKFRSNENGKGI